MSFRMFVLVIAAALPAAAQTKISGTANCLKPDPSHTLEVGDRPGHAMTLSKSKCAWTRPLEMEGLKAKEGEGTQADDGGGKSVRNQGYFVGVMENGDKFFVRYQGSTAGESGDGKWSYANGTGKLRGLKGSGTYKSKIAADGSSTVEVEGEYSVAPAAKK